MGFYLRAEEQTLKTFLKPSHTGLKSFIGAALVAVDHVSSAPEPLKAASDLCQVPIRG